MAGAFHAIDWADFLNLFDFTSLSRVAAVKYLSVFHESSLFNPGPAEPGCTQPMQRCSKETKIKSNYFSLHLLDDHNAREDPKSTSTTDLSIVDSNTSTFLTCPFPIKVESSSSRKHAYIILTPLTPLLYSKTGVYRGIHYCSYFCSKT